MSDKHETIRDDDLFYCFVSIQDNSNQFEFYVVPSAVVADFVTMSHKQWLLNGEKRRDSAMRSFMLGSKEFEYPVAMPLVEEYKRRWDLLG